MMTKRINPGNSILYSLTAVIAKQFTVFLSANLFDPRINRPTTGVCLLKAITRNTGKTVEIKDSPKKIIYNLLSAGFRNKGRLK